MLDIQFTCVNTT